MRNYLKELNIVGCIMVYRERNQCRLALDCLYKNCDKVLISLDNWDKETEDFILQYKNKYPDRTTVVYCDEPYIENKNKMQGQIKKRFKIRQAQIREFAIKRLKKLNNIKKIDILIWPDSDEVFINDLPNIIQEFWSREETWMMCGFIEVYDNFKQLISQKMAPHGRIFKYNSDMTVYPWKGRCRYFPYFNERAWKVRHIIVHLCHLTEKYRQRREFFDNKKFSDETRDLWLLPKDVRKMKASEIADYQGGDHGRPSKYEPIGSIN